MSLFQVSPLSLGEEKFTYSPLAGQEVNQSKESMEKDPFFFKIWKRLLGIGILFIVAMGGWFLFGSRSSFSDHLIELDIQAPPEAVSGDLINYVVKYKNENRQKLKETRLIFFYPDNSLSIKDGQWQSLINAEIPLGDLGAGESGQREFSVRLIGQKGEIKKATARFIYSSSNLNSVFEKEVETATNLSAQTLSLILAALPQAISGQTIGYLLDYRNESGADLENWRLSFRYPDDFTFQRAEPPPTVGQNIWQLKYLKAGEGQRLTIEGTLRGLQGESKTVWVEAQKEVNGQWISYQRNSAFSTISSAPLSVEVRINQQEDYVAKLGDSLRYEVVFTNFSEINLSGITLRATLDGSMFDFDYLQTKGFFDRSAKTIVWNAASSPLLNNLAPSQSGAVSFTVPIKSSFPSSGLGAKDLVIKVQVRAETFSIPPGFQFDRLTAQKDLTTKIKSLPVFQQTASYRSSPGLTEGPLPPQVGEKTFYTIKWRLLNTASDALKMEARTVLPVGVEWEGEEQVNAAQSLPQYRTSSREVIWDFGALPAGTGSLAPAYEASFKIAVAPLAQQVGSSLILITKSVLTGEDGLTRQAFSLAAPDLTSNDLTDFPNQGTVVE